MDATIYWGSLDYKFVNSTDHPLRIDASVSGGYVHVKLVGTAPKDKGYDHIVLRHEVVATIQPKMEIDGDKTIITDAGTALDENGNTVNIVVDKDGNKYIKGDMVQYSYVGKTVMAYRDYVDANGNCHQDRDAAQGYVSGPQHQLQMHAVCRAGGSRGAGSH